MARAEEFEETEIECDSCYCEAPVRQMSVTRGSLVCASCVTARAAYVLSCFHIRSPKATKTTKTTKTTKMKKTNAKKKKSATRR